MRFRGAAGDATIDELVVVRADHGVRVRCERIDLDVDSVEHLLAAFAGLAVRRGVVVSVTGGEVPLAGGGAYELCELLASLDVREDAPAAIVARAGEVRVGASSYVFEPGDAVTLDVEVTFEAAAIGRQGASWEGSREAFVREIAPARTFGFRRDGAALIAAGRAIGVDPRCVMVLDDAGCVEPPGQPARPDEFARHKLLDLAGDLYLFGGPPLGRCSAYRPGHAATRRAMQEAFDRGLVRRP